MFEHLRTRVFADGADIDGILKLAEDKRISGFTTNPTLMRQSGIENYEKFARDLLEQVTEQPISFEVFADNVDEIRRQADQIASWGENVYVKVPITTTRGESLSKLAGELSAEGVKVNVTAIFTRDQVDETVSAMTGGASCYLSIFAGRIADAGVDPVPLMRDAVAMMRVAPNAECIWASPREVLNLVQADSVGCHIITMTHDLIRKIDGLGKDLAQFSLETVQMFQRDAEAAGFAL